MPTHLPPLQRLISNVLLVFGVTLCLSATARAQVTVKFSPTQTTTTQSTASTENFSDASVTGGDAAAGTGTYTTFGDLSNGNVDFTHLGTDSFATGSVQAAPPLGHATDKFLAVGTGTGQTPAVMMTFAADDIHRFGFVWGSVDEGNTVTVNFVNNGTPGSVTYTAASIGLTTGGKYFVDFTTTSEDCTIKSVVLSYSGIAFEVANLAYGAIP